ncbi:hypothetical protein DFP72DRAFT_859042 [Ephemerocybe angulata]|uniref:Uncharacterized protein n=1 Tax=Ephemerocybe angulata TaxID=980116 RepID=A0A8H6HCN4_9AGAR|nr:hypothetical protein DFP72DRAFT_859042 [Tulosesus angulatus]
MTPGWRLTETSTPRQVIRHDSSNLRSELQSEEMRWRVECFAPKHSPDLKPGDISRDVSGIIGRQTEIRRTNPRVVFKGGRIDGSLGVHGSTANCGPFVRLRAKHIMLIRLKVDHLGGETEKIAQTEIGAG